VTLFRAIDLETTGIPSETDKHAIVEIGWCDLEDGEVGIPDAVLCNPGRQIPHEAMAVHHITDAMVEDATGSIEVLGKPDYFVAHFADYERQFFTTDVPFICTWKVALRLWPDAPAHGLQFLRYHLALPVVGSNAMPPHRAAPDAYLGALLMQRILAEGTASVDEMVRWSNGPALMPRITFGKHFGVKWEDVPTDYLDWMLTDPRFSKDPANRDNLANARYHLKKRAADQDASQ
jgi:exodeoxyribonuclease X